MFDIPSTRWPVPTTQRSKWLAAWFVVLACAVFYGVPPVVSGQHATSLNLSSWERAIPYWPYSVWAYVAQYPLLVAVYAVCQDQNRMGRFLYASCMVQALAGLVFMFYPVRYPRPPMPQTWQLDALTAALVQGVRSVDAPLNCLPSLHVTSCLLCIWMAADQSRAWRLGVALVAIASMASTLTFKQHYFVDLAAAVPLAALGWWLAGQMTSGKLRVGALQQVNAPERGNSCPAIGARPQTPAQRPTH